MSEQHAQARHALHWLPNALTVSRILLIPVLVWGILASYDVFDGASTTAKTFPIYIAFGVFIYCIATDYFDGYLARKLNIASDFGRMLDPIADKLLVAAGLISFMVISNGAPLLIIPGLIIIGRDIFVSGIREHAANSNIILSPTKLAKWKTAAEMVALTFLIGARIFFAKTPVSRTAQTFHSQSIEEVGKVVRVDPSVMLEQSALLTNIGVATLWLAAILSAYTGFHYFRSAMRKA